MTKRDLQEIEAAISRLSAQEKRYLLSRIRDDLGKHPLELEWNTDAETIVRAIARSNDFTRRGIRGVLAEDALASNVIEQLTGWEYGIPSGNHPYDFAIEDGSGTVTIQAKNQRVKAGKPLLGGRKYGDVFMVEIWKSRRGRDASGQETRYYRFGDFDLLAVCLHPSTGRWDRFLFTVANWLLPRGDDPDRIEKFQPVPRSPNEAWTDDLETCIAWFRSGAKGRVWPTS